MCDHGVKRQYKPVMKKDGSMSHVFECVGAAYPDPNQCKAVWINKAKETK